MQKYVEIKRDDLTLRGMLHIPNDVSQKSAYGHSSSWFL